MTHKVSVCILIFALVDGYVDSAASNFFQICRRAEPNMSQCLQNTVQNLLHQFSRGIPELDLPSIDPLKIYNIPFKGDSDKKGFINNLTNVEIWGLPQTNVINITSKLTKRSFLVYMKLNVPKLRIEGNYYMNSQVLFLKLKGRGFIQINATDVFCDFRFKANRIQRNGKEYLQFEKMTGGMELGKPLVNLQGFFKDPTLSKATNDLVEENFQLLFEDVKPSVLDALFTYFTDLSNKATQRFTLDELLPKLES